MDMHISIKDLSVTTIIGIYEHERTTPQELLFTIDICFDGEQAAQLDRIEDTIDYYQMSEDIAHFVEGSNYNLLERLISAVADRVLAHPRAHWCRVSATKPEVVTRAKAISLTVERQK